MEEMPGFPPLPHTVMPRLDLGISWLLMNKRLDRRHDRSTLILQALLPTACTFIIARRAVEC
jgi:hypothetical protein